MSRKKARRRERKKACLICNELINRYLLCRSCFLQQRQSSYAFNLKAAEDALKKPASSPAVRAEINRLKKDWLDRQTT